MQISMNTNICMNNKIDREDLERILTEHKAWLDDHNAGTRAVLRDMNLSEMDLSGLDFSHADMFGVNLRNSNLEGANLSCSYLLNAFMMGANLSKANLDYADCSNATISHSNLSECSAESTRFMGACMWDSNLTNSNLKHAIFITAKVCDCDFTGSDLEKTSFIFADLDNAVYKNTNLKESDFSFADRTFWSDFSNADMTGAMVEGIDLDTRYLENVKGLYRPQFCPEEGSFIAWKKCREGKTVKLLIPETAKREGYSFHSCRASEALVLEVFDKDGAPVDEAISIIDESFKYIKGKKAVAKKEEGDYENTVGIFFVLSREETVSYHE